MACQFRDWITVGKRPEPDQAVSSRGSELVALRRNGAAQHTVVMRAELAHFPSHGQVPDADGSTVAAGGQDSSIAGQCSERKLVRITAKNLPRSAVRQIPQSQ